MHARQPAAAGVDRKFAARRNGAALHEPSPLALRAKAKILKKQDRVDGEGVIKHHQIHIALRQTCHGKGA